MQKIYTIFSGSTSRWDLLKKHVNKLTPKPLSYTRWECKLESVKSIRYQVTDFCKALNELGEITKDPKIKSEVLGVETELNTFEFLLSLIIWYDLLNNVNKVSKILQSSTMNISGSYYSFTRIIEIF